MRPETKCLIRAMAAEAEGTNNEALARYALLLMESEFPLVKLHVPDTDPVEDVDRSRNERYDGHSATSHKEAPADLRRRPFKAFGAFQATQGSPEFQKVTENVLRKRQAREEEERERLGGYGDVMYFIADGKYAGDSILDRPVPEGGRLEVGGVAYRVAENCTLYEEAE